MSAPRIRRVTTIREMESVRDDFITQGYSVKSSGENTAMLSNAGWGTLVGHTVVFLLTVWWTFGLGNLLYAVLAHTKGDEVLIKLDVTE